MINLYFTTYLTDKIANGPKLWLALGTDEITSSGLGDELIRGQVRHQVASGNTITCIREWNLEDRLSGIITELALFDDDNNMIASTNVESINKMKNDEITIQWELII